MFPVERLTEKSNKKIYSSFSAHYFSSIINRVYNKLIWTNQSTDFYKKKWTERRKSWGQFGTASFAHLFLSKLLISWETAKKPCRVVCPWAAGWVRKGSNLGYLRIFQNVSIFYEVCMAAVSVFVSVFFLSLSIFATSALHNISS